MVLEPDNVKHPYMLSLVLLQTGRNQEAEAVLNDALRLLPSETDWRKGHQMIRRILLRQEPLPQFPVAGLLTPDSTNSATQRGSK
jgi:cytochrome c-type biogenesis protein CcmH/NrfG